MAQSAQLGLMQADERVQRSEDVQAKAEVGASRDSPSPDLKIIDAWNLEVFLTVCFGRYDTILHVILALDAITIGLSVGLSCH